MEPILALMIPIVALCIPIVAIWTKHQQTMAELMRRDQPQDNAEVVALRREVAELKEMVHTQMLALDVYSTGRSRSSEQNLQERISPRNG